MMMMISVVLLVIIIDAYFLTDVRDGWSTADARTWTVSSRVILYICSITVVYVLIILRLGSLSIVIWKIDWLSSPCRLSLMFRIRRRHYKHCDHVHNARIYCPRHVAVVIVHRSFYWAIHILNFSSVFIHCCWLINQQYFILNNTQSFYVHFMKYHRCGL